jgi:cyclic pyranopterin phosphate synthase
MQENQLIDAFGRQHDYLRISLTDACNLRCVYCMPDEKSPVTPSAKMMQAEEIEGIARVFVEMGVKKIRLTGGEPLLRKDARVVIQKLSALPVELAISTNAVLADAYIDAFREANIRSVNISLDTLNPDEFKAITQRGDFEKITSNIHLLLKQNFSVKVNMVVMKGINEQAVLDFVAWTKEYALDVRFIEFMPFAGNKWNRDRVVPSRELLERIENKYPVDKLEDQPSDTARKYKVPGHAGSFAFISTVSEPFCGNCNRLRLTADGKMKNCLFSTSENDLLSAWRKGLDIRPMILSNLGAKKKERGGVFDAGLATDPGSTSLNVESNRSMIRIGG